ncbi:MAG: CRISPR-associated endonuclease Cas9 REC1/REC2 domain-containing protein [Oscillospiraceae bacterium]
MSELREAEEGTMLPLQRNKDNSVVPNQVHKAELALYLRTQALISAFLMRKMKTACRRQKNH